MALLSDRPPIIPLSACPRLLVWVAEAGSRGVSGVAADQATAERQILAALETLGEGRARVRSARVSSFGVLYTYGATLATAHRKDGVTTIVTGDAWVTTP
ncbi:hypothetical protein C1I98_21565 [Spongiactinospora gelatinilytica]|uniref:Uncharacterized protein n=1 Tax=Spongiactinospora gelatinilytica TaxID=2666298 RepID=A0A2W2HR60_9ACTN|nr:hypothetical protein [Spongiactinospora gelatinilytica]PZG41214.1 hypothetical protein C1I98_21565 [Spongiactinospora gelatinilytica]